MRALGMVGVVILVLLAVMAVPSAHAANGLPPNAPTFVSAYIIPGIAVVEFGYVSWGGQWQAAVAGSQIYTGQLTIILFAISPYPQSLFQSVKEPSLNYVENTSVLIQPNTESVITVNPAVNTNWNTISISYDNVSWSASIAVPISFLPNSILQLGGLDLLVLAVISESILAFGLAVALARWCVKRALFAPKFSLIIWGHVILAILLAVVVFDFQWIDSTFAGLSPLVYVLTVFPMFWAFSLSFFNQSRKNEILRRDAQPEGKILYHRELYRIASRENGDVILVLESWPGFWARFWGHAPVLVTGDPTKPSPFEGEVMNQVSVTGTTGKGPSLTRRRYPWERFEISNPQKDEVQLLQWTDSGSPVEVQWPRLSIHRMKPTKAVIKDGIVIIPAGERNGLCWPYYTEGSCRISLKDEHYAAAEAVHARWATIDDLALQNSKLKIALQAIKGFFHRFVEAEVESRLYALDSLEGRANTLLSMEEAIRQAGEIGGPNESQKQD